MDIENNNNCREQTTEKTSYLLFFPSGQEKDDLQLVLVKESRNSGSNSTSNDIEYQQTL